ncbi:MAG: transposase [Deltaproteobacteria bacterium]|nr:transposase [Deltaproteobacteria bacterium]
MGKKKKVQIGSIDSTGFEARHVSQYFLQRSEQDKPIYARFHPKLTVICDCETHLIHGFHATKGPKPDNRQLQPTLKKTITEIDKLLGDAGFDGEPNHRICREENNIRSFFPPLIGRPTQKPPSGYWRRKMKHYFNDPQKHKYGQRWQVETVFSMIKRSFGSALSARTHHNRLRQLYLLVISHNIAILF